MRYMLLGVGRALLTHGLSPELERVLAETPYPLFEPALESFDYTI